MTRWATVICPWVANGGQQPTSACLCLRQVCSPIKCTNDALGTGHHAAERCMHPQAAHLISMQEGQSDTRVRPPPAPCAHSLHVCDMEWMRDGAALLLDLCQVGHSSTAGPERYSTMLISARTGECLFHSRSDAHPLDWVVCQGPFWPPPLHSQPWTSNAASRPPVSSEGMQSAADHDESSDLPAAKTSEMSPDWRPTSALLQASSLSILQTCARRALPLGPLPRSRPHDGPPVLQFRDYSWHSRGDIVTEHGMFRSNQFLPDRSQTGLGRRQKWFSPSGTLFVDLHCGLQQGSAALMHTRLSSYPWARQVMRLDRIASATLLSWGACLEWVPHSREALYALICNTSDVFLVDTIQNQAKPPRSPPPPSPSHKVFSSVCLCCQCMCAPASQRLSPEMPDVILTACSALLQLLLMTNPAKGAGKLLRPPPPNHGHETPPGHESWSCSSSS